MTHVPPVVESHQSDDGLAQLAEELAALRRVATLVAEGATITELTAAVAEEVARLLRVTKVTLDRYELDGSVVLASVNDPGFPVGSRWPHDGPSLGKTVYESGRSARIDDYATLPSSSAAAARDTGIGSAAGVPIVVEGRVWGVICVGAGEGEFLPADTETRLERFTELLATAIANAEARDNLQSLVKEQSALRRVATLIAEGKSGAELFPAVAEEIARALDVPAVTIGRYDADASIVIASFNDPGFPIGSVWPHDEPSLGRTVCETGLPARIDDHSGLAGAAAARNREFGVRSIVAAPIVVGGTPWGDICAATTAPEPLPPDTEARLGRFTDLVATAISNAEARDGVRRLADEQAALRRVATLVAEGATGDVLFAAVAEQAAHFLGGAPVTIDRYQPDGTTEVIATWGDAARVFEVGDRWPIEPESLAAKVLETGAAGRVGDYSNKEGTIAAAMRTYGGASTVGVPIVVDGTVWGLICTGTSRSTPKLPADAEARLTRFTELVATAISNSEARDDVRELLDEQAALRRVATLVAEGTTAEHLFSAVTDEVARLLGVPVVTLDRYEGNVATIVLAATYTGEVMYEVGSRWPLDGPSVAATILETGRSARINDYSNLTGTIASVHVAQPHVSSFGVPIVVDGKVWGMIGVGSSSSSPLPSDTEARLTRFTELVATAVSNATGRSELIASRARIVAAGDEARRRIERDLHDGTQQRLIAVGLDVDALRTMVSPDEPMLQSGLERVASEIESVIADVRELSHGLHPALLSRHGLGPSLRTLARRCPIPVAVKVDLPRRPPSPVETGVYYVVSEALTNVAKHSRASEVSVTVTTEGSWLQASIVDDGVGGAESTEGSGLAGLVDRVVALGGRFAVESPRGGGTRITVAFPVEER